MITTTLVVAVLAAWLPTINSAPAGTADAPKKLGDAFDVWTGEEADSCAKYYDHAVGLGQGGGKVLNDQWDQIVDMNAAALASLSADKYDDSLTIRNHVKNFFGMAPWKTQAGTDMAPPAPGKKKVRLPTPENARSREMYEHLMLWFNNIDGYIKRKAGKTWTSNLKPPILACGSKFMHPVTPDDYGRDTKTGKLTAKKLKEVPQVAGLFEKNYVFWLDAPFNTYWSAPKTTLPNPRQWPKDSDGEQHYCAAPEHTSLTLLSKQSPTFKAIIVCPRALDTSNDKGLEKPVTSEQPKEKSLDDMGTQSLHLYQQMFKLFHGEIFVEQIEEDPRDRQVYIAATKAGWPGKADAWKPAGTTEKPVYVSTGIDALWLTIHDRAEEAKTEQEAQFIKDLDALNSPVNFAWFALVNLMSLKTGQDWCTGRPRPAASPWMLVSSKSANSPGTLFSENDLKQMSQRRLGLPATDSSDSDEKGGPSRANTAPDAVGSYKGKGKKPASQQAKPQPSTPKAKPVAFANPAKPLTKLIPAKSGSAGTQVSTGGAQGQVTTHKGAMGHLASAQDKQSGQHGSSDASSGSESESR